MFGRISKQNIILLGIVLFILITLKYKNRLTIELFEDNGHRRLADYLPNYVVDVQRRCLPGEKDMDRYCVREGCPPGMERGAGDGEDMCYAP